MTVPMATDGPKRHWVLLFAAVLLFFTTGNFTMLLSQHLGAVRVAPTDLPPGAREITTLGNGWHTFRLEIAGKDRLLLRRLYPNYNNTESLTELVGP